jgi:signal transduction histidine kinase
MKLTTKSRRPVALRVLATVSAILAVLIALEAISAIRSRTRLLRESVESAADYGARLAGDRVQRDIMTPVVAPLGSAALAALGRRRAPDTSISQRNLLVFAREIQSQLHDCACVARHGLVAYVGPRAGVLSIDSSGDPGGTAAVLRWLRDSLPVRAHLPHRATRRLMDGAQGPRPGAGGGNMVFGIIAPTTGASPRLFAYAAHVDVTGALAAAFVVELEPRPFLVAAVDASSATPLARASGKIVNVPLTIDVVDARGRFVFEQAGARWAATKRVVQLPVDEGNLALQVYLAHDVTGLLNADSVILQNDAWRVALSVLLFAGTLALLALAVAQLGRELKLARLREQFVSGVSHELRTPLAQIRLFAELLAECGTDRDDQRQDYTRIINDESMRLTHLVDNVLTFTTLGVERPSAHAVIALDRLIRETAEQFAPLAGSRRVVLRVDSTPPARVLGNASAIRQILLNLLDNAVKYGPAGQVITVSSRVEHGRAEMAVEDEGPGIPFRDRERVFDAFFRLPRDASGETGGSGIGLAVVRELVRAQRGSIAIEDARPRGTRVVVRLPLLAVSPGEAPTAVSA